MGVVNLTEYAKTKVKDAHSNPHLLQVIAYGSIRRKPSVADAIARKQFLSKQN